MPRIYELGGELYRDLRELHDDAAYEAAYLLPDVTGLKAILHILLEAERCAEHEDWFEEVMPET